jgi:hypothetical protein
MAYAYENQTISAFGIPYTEYRTAPSPTDVEIVTIEFIPDPDNNNTYGYSHPRYTFTETVALRKDWERCQQNNLDWHDELTFYRVCSLQLLESFSKRTGRLVEAPSWLFGVRSLYSRELLWFSEDELISVREMQQVDDDYYEF